MTVRNIAGISCEQARSELIDECITMDVVDRDIYFQQQAFNELTSSEPQVAAKAPGKYNEAFAVHVRSCEDCQAYFMTEEFKRQKSATLRRHIQMEDEWARGYEQHARENPESYPFYTRNLNT